MTSIRHVSDTALWVAMYRAFETDRPDALFEDPYARRLAGERGEQIVQAMPRGRSLAWPMIVRTAVMDEIILRAVAGGTRMVLNLGAGLDTRAYRLALPPTLRWFDVDLPDMIAYRREHLSGATPTCLHEDVAADLSDVLQRSQVLARADASDGPTLVVTEGLLIYLAPEQVKVLAAELNRHSRIRWWLTDLATPLLLERLKGSWQAHLTAANTPMRFAPAEGPAFFAPSGWREAEFRSVWEESLRLRRSVPLAQLWDFLNRFRPKEKREAFRRMSGVVLLERDDDA